MIPVPDGEESSSRDPEDDSIDYKPKYRYLKRKLKCLLYEQECFQEELRRLQRKLLRVNRDKSFLLDRLLQYEPPEFSSSDEEETESSADEQDQLKSYWNSQAVPPPQDNKPVKKAVSSVQGTSASASASASVQGGKGQQKPIRKKENVERVRCMKRVENGKRCSKMVSKKIKSGLCLMHREEENQQDQITNNQPAPLARKQQAPSRITNIKMGSSNIDASFFNQPNPMISGISSEHAQQAASATIPPDIYGISEDLKTSGPADSPASTDFPGNIYEGDDDLVIDLPE